MEVNSFQEMLLFLGAFITAAFSLIRLSLAQHKAMMDRFMRFLETGIARQENMGERFADTLSSLRDGVQENTQVLRRVAERLQVNFTDRSK